MQTSYSADCKKMDTSEHKSPSDQLPSMAQLLRNANVAIVGGGVFCRKLIKFFRKFDLAPQKPNIIGVADINPHAEGFVYARRLGIFTTTDYTRLYKLKDLQILLEITHDLDLAVTIRESKPKHVQLVDHFKARYLWDALQVENIRCGILEKFHQKKYDPKAIDLLFKQSFDIFNNIITRRNDRSRQIELELVENERAQSQIIQGSTIPTFFINKDHIVTHWNKALEKLTGVPAEQVVGTNRQWEPFWQSERPTMADVILDQTGKNEIRKLYGSKWQESALIEGAYEAEVFFPHMGESGKWIWFTAAPIKAPDGTIVGAIETLWDKSEDKKAEEQREKHTQELAALCSIYTALSAPWQIDQRIEACIREIQHYFRADDISIILQGDEKDFFIKYHYGRPKTLSPAEHSQNYKQFIHDMAHKGEVLLIEDLDSRSNPDITPLAQAGFKSVVFIPIIAKEKKSIGVLQIASNKPRQFASIERRAMDLIGNRIGVAIENDMLQQQYIRSEEKYRSLFNNDPNPIFIVHRQTLEILDTNERAQECYGYKRDELHGMSFLKLGEADDREVEYGFRHLPLGQSILLSKRRHFRKGGRSFYVNISLGHASYGDSDVFIATTTDVTESMEKETQLIQAGKMTTLGMMAAGMAHEINQPLNVIQICADFILKKLKKGQSIGENDIRSIANDIITNVDRATGIIKHVRHFARQSEVARSKVHINAPIQDVFKVLGHQIRVHQIELDLELDASIPCIMADHNRLEQVFINLVTNAIDAMDEKAEMVEYKGMTKRLQIRTFKQNGKVVATVKDNGIGMSEAVKSQIYEPFFTTKEVGKGTGLGVSISYGIIKDYEGSIDIDSQVGSGTTFILTFPTIKINNEQNSTHR